MANTFKNASAQVGLSAVAVYTAPAATAAVVFGLYLANIDNTEVILVDVEVFDDSGALVRTVGKQLPVPIGSTLDFGKITLEENDALRVTASKAASIDAFANVLEIS